MAKELKVRVTGDATGFNATLTRAKTQANAFATRMRTMASSMAGRFGALFSTVAVGMAVRKTIEWADVLADTSRRLNVNVEQLQKWEYAATQTGSSLKALTNTIEKLKKSQGDAARGLSTSIIGMQALGITGTDTTEQMLDKLAALAQSGRIHGLTGPLKDIGGRGATELIPALKQWQQLADAAERTGVVMKEEQVQVLEKIKDQFTFMGRFMMATLAPAIQYVNEKLVMMHAVIAGLGSAAGLASTDPTAGAAAVKSIWKAFAGQVQTIIGSDDLKKNGERLIEEAGVELYGTGHAGTPGNKVFSAYANRIEKAAATIQRMRVGAPVMDDIATDGGIGGTTSRFNRQKANTDSLAKVGLYTASGLNTAPIMESIQRQQLKELAEIRRNTKTEDPFA